jgi:signal transduction histidine kinase
VLEIAEGSAPRSDASLVEAIVEDDGTGLPHEIRRETGFGLGLIGIRERALALGGETRVVPGHERGLILSVVIPVAKTTGATS